MMGTAGYPSLVMVYFFFSLSPSLVNHSYLLFHRSVAAVDLCGVRRLTYCLRSSSEQRWNCKALMKHSCSFWQWFESGGIDRIKKKGESGKHRSAIRLAQILGAVIRILQSRDFILERGSGGGRVMLTTSVVPWLWNSNQIFISDLI